MVVKEENHRVTGRQTEDYQMESRSGVTKEVVWEEVNMKAEKVKEKEAEEAEAVEEEAEEVKGEKIKEAEKAVTSGGDLEGGMKAEKRTLEMEEAETAAMKEEDMAEKMGTVEVEEKEEEGGKAVAADEMEEAVMKE